MTVMHQPRRRTDRLGDRRRRHPRRAVL